MSLDERTGLEPEAIERAVRDHLLFTRAKDLHNATAIDLYHAVAHAVRDRMAHAWIHTQRTYANKHSRRVCYLSAEYLLGRQLEQNLIALDIRDAVEEGLAKHGITLQSVLDVEHDPGLGNGGLGRLAACFMESCATLSLPAIGYGIRYEFGIFRQHFEDGWQVERPDEWLRDGNPWEIARPEYCMKVGFGGTVHHIVDADGKFRPTWVPEETVLGVPYDTPVAGYRTPTVNTLRLWSARASEQFDLAVFNDGDYRRAVENKALSESISKVLYPRDDSVEGKRLRLRQQLFFVSCSLQDILRRIMRDHDSVHQLPELTAIQLNDTHPALAIPELMRLLIDEHGLGWAEAWDLTQRTMGYTNHTLLPEALERWSIDLFGALLPRHLEIVAEIDRRWAREVHVLTAGDTRVRNATRILDDHVVHMARLAVVASHTVNGVADLHAKLLRERVMPEFAAIFPDRFTGITNGVTPRRFLRQCNPRLSALLDERLGGPQWTTDLSRLSALSAFADDERLHTQLSEIKLANKVAFSQHLAERNGIQLDPTHLFDVQVKRIHEYKRQLLMLLFVIHRWARIRLHGASFAPRTVLIGGKAAPGYARAKQILKVIHDVAEHVNADPLTRDQIRLHFLPDYDVSLAERLIPAADLSEQISMAGKEASGTGNMKFQFNGALTIGTLDGANIEIRDAVGERNFFLFGLDANQAEAVVHNGKRPYHAIESSTALAEAIELLEDGTFAPESPEVHHELARYLREEDPFLVTADFADYLEAQRRVDEHRADPTTWARSVVHNLAGAGFFSSDRAVQEYSEQIWHLVPTSVLVPGR